MPLLSESTLSLLMTPEPWDGTEWEATRFSDIQVQFEGTPTTPYQPQQRMGATWVNCLAFDALGNTYSTVTGAGIYRLEGGFFVRFSAGAGSTLTRRAAS